MNIAVLSGKGGAGKTFVSVNLAAAAPQAVYIDCDVEEPNGRLFLKPESVESREVQVMIPEFDPERCTGCRKCVDVCRFHALVYIRKKPKVFPQVCHSCGACAYVCPAQAISEVGRTVGHVEHGTHRNIDVYTGVLDLGEASGSPVIGAALEDGIREGQLHILDCPPGSACPVLETVSHADVCVLVAEPTKFGFHNFCMVHELAEKMGKPCGVVVNKMEDPYEPLETYCAEHQLPILDRISYDPNLARLGAGGGIYAEQSEEAAQRFRVLLEKIGGLAQ